MNKNYIAEFMKENDLKIGDAFRVINQGTYHFEDDFAIYDKDGIYDDELLLDLLSGECKVSVLSQEYVQVDNSIPRFTEIEVRNGDWQEWIKAIFIFKTEVEGDCYCYGVLDEEKCGLKYYEQARMLKPSEPEFKEGELIEVSDNNKHWYERIYIGMVNEFYICRRNTATPVGWEYARKIEGK